MLLFLAIAAATAPAEPSLLMTIALKYQDSKTAINQWGTFSEPELHVHLGLLVFFLAMILLRKPLKSPWPWLAVALFEGINEYFAMVTIGSWNWPDTKFDIFYTLLWPTLLSVAARIGLIPQE